MCELELGTSTNPPRANILGVHVSIIDLHLAVRTINTWIIKQSPHYVCVTPAHGIMDCLKDSSLRIMFNSSGLTTPDGMGVVWTLKLMGHGSVGRVYGPDLMRALCEHSVTHGYRHFFYGGLPGVADQLAQCLVRDFPGLQIAGTESPPFRPLSVEEDHAMVERLNASCPDIIWVGISTPKQERWMYDHVGKLDAPVLIGVGAAFDFLSGRKPQAPRWIQNIGMEWLFRLASEPRRLFPRYMHYPHFATLVAAQILGLKSYD
jgi:N-acetylglucosaminyldiphosphoundecaprenol N-acetyl-beta-D-mannosaminyltransferase